MTLAEWAALAPLGVLCLTVIALLVVASFGRSARAMAAVAVLGHVGAGVTALAGTGWASPVAVGRVFSVDAIGLLALTVAVFSGAAVSALAAARHRSLAEATPSRAPDVPELHLLIALAATGAGVVALASHVVTMMLGLEIAAVSYTAAVAWRRDLPDAIEAAVKLLVLGAVGSSFVLFGAALAYASTGSLAVAGLAQAGLLPAALVAVGVAIKAGAAPFHAWVADAWHGTTGPVALLLGTTAKAGLLAAALHAWPQGERGALVALAVLSMIGGALLGLNQTRVRRVLAASSVNHMGDLLLGVAVGGAAGQQAVGLYLVGYALSQIALFAWLELWAGAEEVDDLDALRGRGAGEAGWGWTVAVASLAGLPFTAGFVGKLALLQAAVGVGLVGPALALAVGSVISGGAYLRLLGPVWAPGGAAVTAGPSSAWFARLATLGVLALGVAPAWWVGWVALFL